MLPRRLHLNLRQDRDFFKSAKKQHGKDFSILWQGTVEPLRVAFIVPKRVVGKATQRNYVRRRLEQEILHHKHELTEARGKMVVIVRRTLPPSEIAQVGKQLVQYIQKHGFN